MEEEQFEEVNKKLDKIIRLLALQSIAGKKGVEAIRGLSAAGFQPKDIAEILGTTPNTVRVSLSTMKKKKVKRNAKED